MPDHFLLHCLVQTCVKYDALVKARPAVAKGVRGKRAWELTALAAVTDIPGFAVDHGLSLLQFIKTEKYVDAAVPWGAWGLVPPAHAAAATILRTAKFPNLGKTNCAAFAARVEALSPTQFRVVGFKGVVRSGVQLLQPGSYHIQTFSWLQQGFQHDDFRPSWLVTLGEELAPNMGHYPAPTIFADMSKLEQNVISRWQHQYTTADGSSTSPTGTPAPTTIRIDIALDEVVVQVSGGKKQSLSRAGWTSPPLFVFVNSWVVIDFAK
jgi:hypothetical protein